MTRKRRWSHLFPSLIGFFRVLRVLRVKTSHLGCVSALACMALASPIRAQTAGSGAQRTVTGTVQRPGDKRPVAVPRAWVVLHRVGSDRAAPLDSVRAGRDGGFRFRYAVSGSPDAIYFVSTTFRGIAYFTSPLRERVVRGGDADLLVYDTTTAVSTLRLQGRHIVVSAVRNGRRDIAEIFEIENDGTRTVVARDSTRPLWAAQFPADAESLAVAPGDVGAGAVTFRDGRGEMFAPVSPGVRQLGVTYRLPLGAFPLTVPLDQPVTVLEVLLEEPRAVVSGAGLTETAGADIDGRRFRRFLARDVPPTATLLIKAQAPASGSTATILALAITLSVGMGVAFAVWYSQRRAVSSLAPALTTSDVMVAELASLDARFAKLKSVSAEERARHERQRAELKARITQTLARESPPA